MLEMTNIVREEANKQTVMLKRQRANKPKGQNRDECQTQNAKPREREKCQRSRTWNAEPREQTPLCTRTRVCKEGERPEYYATAMLEKREILPGVKILLEGVNDSLIPHPARRGTHKRIEGPPCHHKPSRLALL